LDTIAVESMAMGESSVKITLLGTGTPTPSLWLQ